MRPNTVVCAAAGLLVSALCALAGAASPRGDAAGNSPPDMPLITEPAQDGMITNPEDTHMETGPFSDPDPGDTHLCSDWEIWTITPSQRVWAAPCVTGPEKLHCHLGDGVFEGSHAGRTSLLQATNYRLRARHRDSSGVALTEWSPYAQRLFTTGQLSTVFPLEMDDILDSPVPTWLDTTGAPAVLPPGGIPPALFAESAAGELMLSITGSVGGNVLVNPPPIAEHVPLRIRVSAGGQALLLPETDLAFTDHTGVDRVLFLPAITLPAAQTAHYWVSANGSTYVGSAAQTVPDFSTLARGAGVPWAAESGFKVEAFASGFQLPVNIAFVPNPGVQPTSPLFYVTELYGAIRVVRRNGTVGLYAGNLLNFNPTGNFPGSGEQGVTGIVVEPATGDLFVALLYDSQPPSELHYPEVVRFHSNDGGQTAAIQTAILNMVGETQGQSHQISNLTIGPDGKLYVHMGDGFVSTTALNLESYRGKILRANLDGTAPADNPLYNGAPITSRDYVFAYGVRNPFGGAWRASDGKHYEIENGPSIDRFAKVSAGQNFTWNGNQSTMLSGALYTWDPSVGPVNIVFVQPSTFGGSQFPAGKQGHAFVSESGSTWGTGPQPNGKRITEWVLDAAGNLASGPTPLISYNGSGKATCVGLAAGPDGLYFTDLYKDEAYQSPIDPGANVLRVRFVGAAAFAADVTNGAAPLTVHFSDLSTVPSPTAWLWTFGDGASSTAQDPVHVYTQDGVYNVRLSVTGPAGVAVHQKNGYIQVGQVPRIALIGGALPPGAGDQAVADHLAAHGLIVDTFDDEPANRPTAQQLAADYALVLVSSTVTAGNIAGEFRTADVPLVFWEQGLLRLNREALADDGIAVGNVTGINVLSAAHPVTAGLPPGTNGAFSPGATMSVGRGTVAPGAALLATRSGAATDYAILAAEEGAVLLGGYVPPARRVFVYLENTGFLSATPQTEQVLEQAVCWAGNLHATITAPPSPVTVMEGQPAVLTVGAGGAPPLVYQWRRNAVNLSNGGRISGATSATLTIDPALPSDSGQYDVLVSNGCGGSFTAPVALTVLCYADCTGEGQLTVADFGCFQTKFVSGDPYADCNAVGGLTVADFACFQTRFVQGCP